MNSILLAANSSTPLKITSTAEGIRLYTFVSYYNDLLQVTWHYKYDLCLFPLLKWLNRSLGFY